MLRLLLPHSPVASARLVMRARKPGRAQPEPGPGNSDRKPNLVMLRALAGRSAAELPCIAVGHRFRCGGLKELRQTLTSHACR